MPIDPAELARNISALAGLDAEGDLGRGMQQITSAAKELLRVDGAGLMLADERGVLRWAAASNQPTQVIEEGQERLGEGPCVNAFIEHAPMVMRDAAKEPQWGKITDVVTGQEMRPAWLCRCRWRAARSAPWTCIRQAQGLGSGRDQCHPDVRGAGRDPAQPGGGRPGQGAVG